MLQRAMVSIYENCIEYFVGSLAKALGMNSRTWPTNVYRFKLLKELACYKRLQFATLGARGTVCCSLEIDENIYLPHGAHDHSLARSILQKKCCNSR